MYYMCINILRWTSWGEKNKHSTPFSITFGITIFQEKKLYL